jgi:tetratricopeptide (TPR) repeat protein
MKYAIVLLTGTLIVLSSAVAQDSPDLAAVDDQIAQIRAQMPMINDQMAQLRATIPVHIQENLPFAFMFDSDVISRADRNDRDYRAGTRAIDQHDYEGAIKDLDQVINAKSKHSDAALYWKAYAQLKMGHSEGALATLTALNRLYPNSSWLNDAKALNAEARSQTGHPVSPETAADDDLKVLALNGLMHSNPAQATPIIEKFVSDPKNSPQLRERALFVLARSNEPSAQKTVSAIAQGSANPDLQAKAIQYLAVTNAKESSNIFTGIYQRSSDPQVKRAALNALFLKKDANALVSIARHESNPQLKREAVQRLAAMKDKAATDYMLEILNK